MRPSLNPLRCPPPCLDPEGSPDPTRNRVLTASTEGWYHLPVFPHLLIGQNLPSEVRAWGDRLDQRVEPPPVEFALGPSGEQDLLLDFGTELEGSFRCGLETVGNGSLALTCGESVPEAMEWGLPSRCREQRPPKTLCHLSAGSHQVEVETGGFRFVRLRLGDFPGSIRLSRPRVEAMFMGGRQQGHFQCTDPALQRLWQTSLYTARLCTRPSGFWDGIKRDRLGWFGDARITHEAWSLGFHQPEPAEALLAQLETGSWANAIPGYSFDAVALFHRHLLHHGLERPATGAIWERIKAFLAWVLGSQVNDDGLITRRSEVDYFFGIGFTDWSPQPLGGRLEEWAPLQFSWLACLRHAAVLAKYLGDPESSAWESMAGALHRKLKARFAAPGGGYHHTLNLAEPPGEAWRMPTEPGLHHRLTYLENRRFGPSGPSLHAGALAVWAGLVEPGEARSLVDRVFRRTDLPAIITTYFHYYLTEAQARCGDPSGALERFRSYFLPMLQRFESATIWESFEPDVSGLAAYSLHSWPKSLCHGWGACFVPWSLRWLGGLEILSPGCSKIRIHPSCQPGLVTRLVVPTPRGEIRFEDGRWSVPQGIDVLAPEGARPQSHGT